MESNKHDADSTTPAGSAQTPAATWPVNRDYDAWIDNLMHTNNEFDYRYIYDAYLVAWRKTPGMYFGVEIISGSDGEATKICHLSYRTGDEDLLLSSEEERLAFIAYLEKRFGRGRSMQEWHDREHAGYLEDRWWLK